MTRADSHHVSTAEHPWAGLRIPDMLARTASKYPDNVALLDGDKVVTYSELQAYSQVVAANLAAEGVQDGDHVALFIGENWRHAVILHALGQLGAVAVPMHLGWESDEILHALDAADITHLIAGVTHRDRELITPLRKAGIDLGSSVGGLPARLKSVIWDVAAQPDVLSLESFFSDRGNPVPSSQNETAYIMFTSGTTAWPKAAVIRHESTLGCAYYLTRAMRINAHDVYLNISPFYHCGGLVGVLLAAQIAGAAVRLVEGFRLQPMLDLAVADGATVLIGMDVVNMRLFEASLAQHGRITFERVMSGPGRGIYDQMAERDVDVNIVYGLSEASHIVSVNSPSDAHSNRRESNGFPLPGCEVRVCDYETGAVLPAGEFGEIRFRGWNLMSGYYQKGKGPVLAADDDGFFCTGDYGFMDQAGRVYYRGRYSGMVKTGGENVSQAEVEGFISTLPGVRQVAVVGVPDDKWGEAVVAFIEMDSATPDLDLQSLKDMCRGKLAGYKIPKQVHVLRSGEWPVTAAGKIVKSTLVERAGS